MIPRLVRNIFTADILGLILITVALQALTYGVSSSLRNTDTQYFFWVCLLAVLIGFGLSKTRFNGIEASAAMVTLGLIGVWILGARLTSPLLDLGNVLLSILPQIIPAIESRTPIDTTRIAEAWLVITQASSALGVRVQTWLIGLDQNVTVNDALVRNMVWILILWLTAAWMGWFTGRRNAVASLLPAIALLAIITSYSEYKIETLWLMVFVLLLLMGIWNYRNHTKQWESRRIDYSESIRYDSTQAVVFLALLIGAIAFIMPSVSWREIRDFLRERNQASENEAADLLGIQRQPASPGNTFVQKASLPREHLLTGGYAQSQKIVMTIRTGELPPVPNPELLARDPPPRYYWRSTTYDTYVGAGWVTSSAPPQTIEANTPLIPGLLDGYKLVHLDVQMVEPEGKLFWSGILFSTDIPFTAEWRVRPGSSLFADRSALLQADMFAARSNADEYKADAYVPLASTQELRAALTDYPAEIRERYILLPRSVPERVHQLAHRLTDGKVNAYDKAKAIEAYLRTYPYDLEVPAPPEDQDVADYFLFDLRKGYCDYYATAMVVLARSSGLPARFVSGYASGSYDAPNAQYVVRELHAHSWAEVYFPEIGWVEFEPTAAQPEIDHSTPEEIAAGSDTESTASRLLYRFQLEQAMYWLSPLAGILLLSLLYFAFIERWWLMRLAPEIAIERIYRRLYRLGRPLAGERTRAETASEFMQKLLSRIDTLGSHSYSTKLFSSARQDLELLTGLYQNALFSHNNIEKSHSRKAWDAWRHLRLRLMLARINFIARRPH